MPQIWYLVGALRHINPEKGTSLHVHAVPEKGTSIDKRHINSFNSPMCMLSLNESGLEAILAFGTTLWKKHPFLSIWVEILYQKCLRHCNHALLFWGGRPYLCYEPVPMSHMSLTAKQSDRDHFLLLEYNCKNIEIMFRGMFPNGHSFPIPLPTSIRLSTTTSIYRKPIG